MNKEMKYPDRWEQLDRIPKFLTEVKFFRIDHLFDLQYERVDIGSFLVRNDQNHLSFQHVGYDSRIEKDLLALKELLSSFALKFQISASQSIVLSDRKLNVFFIDAFDQYRIFLQITKPNAIECSFTLSEHFLLNGFPSEHGYQEPSQLKHNFEMILSKNGYVIQIPDDPHIWRSFGYTEPLFQGQREWIQETLRYYKIPFSLSDECLIKLYSLPDFLESTDRFRELCTMNPK